MGGADDAHVHGFFLGAAQGADPALLDGAQQLGLHGQRQVADLVEKQRAALGGLEVAGPVLGGAGVRPLARTEEFGLQQVLGNGAAVDGDQRPLRALAAGMQGAGHQFLAGARLPLHQHGGHALGNLGDALLDGLHDDGGTHQRVQRGMAFIGQTGGQYRAGIGRCMGGGGRGCAVAHALDGGGHHLPELLEVHGLGQVVEGAGAQRAHGVFGRAVGRDHDAAFAPALFAQLLQYLQAHAVGQAHVGDHDIEAAGAQQLARLLHAGRGFHAVALAQQAQLVERAQIGFVVDHENGGTGHGGHGSTPQSNQTGRRRPAWPVWPRCCGTSP